MTGHVPPDPSPAALLPFDRMADKATDFERLTSDVLRLEDDVDPDQCDLYGEYEQKGIDVLAHRHAGGVVVASCKNYASVNPGQIRKWCDEFLKHWETWWKPKDVRRFILAIGCQARRKVSVLEALKKEEATFEAKGIAFECWDQMVLHRRLRSHYALVDTYFPGGWADKVCKSAQPAPTRASSEAIRITLNRQLDAELDRAGTAYEQGRMEDLAASLSSLFEPTTWTSLSEEAQHGARRLKLSALLDEGSAAEIAAFRKRYPGPIGADLETIVTWQESGAEAALLFAQENDAPFYIEAQLLLALGRYADVIAIGEPKDAVDLTVRARAKAALGDYEAALIDQRDAEADAPLNAGVARSGLAVRFAAATARSHPVCVLSSWPEPLHPALIRHDAGTRALLRHSQRIADDMLARTGLDEAEQGIWRIWKLVFLAMDPSRREEAEAFARDVFRKGAVTSGAVVWSLWAGLDVNLTHAADALQRRLARSKSRPEDLFALLHALEALGRIDEAKTALRRFRRRFAADAPANAAADLWQSRLDGDRPTDLSAAISDARASGDWDPVVDLVQEPSDKTDAGTSTRLVIASEQMADAGAWSALGRLTDQLVGLGTATAISMAIHTHANLGEDAAALALLSDPAPFGGDLPEHLLAMRADLLQRSGDPLEALKVGERLKGTRLDPHGLGQAQRLIAVGDAEGAASIVSQMASDVVPNLSTGRDALLAAHILGATRPEDAKAIVRRVLDDDVPIDLAPTAIDLGYRFGLDELASNVLARAAPDPRFPGQRVSQAEFLAHMAERRRAEAELTTLHRQGTLPFATLADRLDRTTSGLFSRCGLSHDPRLVRHGSRHPFLESGEGPPEDARVVRVDLPFLLVAQEFGFLEPVLAHHERVEVPRSLQSVLLDTARKLRPGQPKVIKALRRALKAIADGHVSIDGQAEIRIALSDEDGDVPLSRLLEAAGVGDEQGVLARGTSILLGDDVLAHLALDEDRLVAVLETFDCRVDPAIEEAMAAHERMVTDRETRAREADALRSRLLRAMRDGRVVVCGTAQDWLEDGDAGPRAETACLKEVMSAEAGDCDAILSGDRVVTGFRTIGSTRIEDVFEVLARLERTGTIPPARGRAIRRRMREANVQFLPFAEEEMLTALRAASIEDERLVETRELATFRRHLAHAVELEDGWRPTPDTGLDGQAIELVPARDAIVGAANLVRRIWEGDEDTMSRAARADYVVENFMTERLERIPVQSPDDGRAWFVTSVGFVLSSVFRLASTKPEAVEAFVAWVRSRLLDDWFWQDDEIVEAVADVMAQGLDVFTQELDGVDLANASKLDRAVAAHIARTLDSLPDQIVMRLVDLGLGPRVGIVRTDKIEIGRVAVTSAAFAKAVRAAVREDEVPLAVHPDSDVNGATFKVGNARRGRFFVGFSDEVYALDDPRLTILAASSDEKVLDDRLPWTFTDADLATLRRGAGTVQTLDDAEKLAERVYGYHLHRAYSAAQEGQATFDHLRPPPVDVLERHLGIAAEHRSLADVIRAHVGQSNQRQQLDVALFLLGALPIPIDGASAALEELEVDARRGAIRDLASPSSSAIRRTHVLHLANALSVPTETIPPTLEECEALAAAFRWVWLETGRMADWRAVPTWKRLALCWYHAGEICELLARLGQAPDRIARVLRAQTHARASDLFLPAHGTDSDVLGPTITAPSLFVGLCTYAGTQPTTVELERMTVDGEMAAGPVIDLVETAIMPDMLGSFVSTAWRCPPEWLRDLLGRFDPEALEQGMPEVLADIQSKDIGHWAAYLHFRRRGLPEDEASLVIDWWRGVDPLQGSKEPSALLFAFAKLLKAQPQLRNEDWVYALLNRYDVTEGSEGQRTASALAECVAQALVVEPDHRSPNGSDDLIEFLHRFDHLAPTIERVPNVFLPILTRLARERPPECNGQLWQRIRALRLLGERGH